MLRLLRAVPAGMGRVRRVTKVHKRRLHLTHAKSGEEEQLSYSLWQGSCCPFESKHCSVSARWAPLGFLSQGWAGIALVLAKLGGVCPEGWLMAGCLGCFIQHAGWRLLLLTDVGLLGVLAVGSHRTGGPLAWCWVLLKVLSRGSGCEENGMVTKMPGPFMLYSVVRILNVSAHFCNLRDHTEMYLFLIVFSVPCLGTLWQWHFFQHAFFFFCCPFNFGKICALQPKTLFFSPVRLQHFAFPAGQRLLYFLLLFIVSF